MAKGLRVKHSRDRVLIRSQRTGVKGIGVKGVRGVITILDERKKIQHINDEACAI